MNAIGNILFIMSGIIGLYKSNYAWIFVGVLLRFIFLVIWLFKYCPTDRQGKASKTNKGANGYSDHFVYYNLFDKYKGGK